MHRDELAAYLDQFLEVPRFRDYCPNGLQVEGREQVRRLASGVSASLLLLEAAAEAGVDAFISGEISEHSVHAARESGVSYLAAGHHATERYGVQALGDHLAARFGLEHRYIEIGNPV